MLDIRKRVNKCEYTKKRENRIHREYNRNKVV